MAIAVDCMHMNEALGHDKLTGHWRCIRACNGSARHREKRSRPRLVSKFDIAICRDDYNEEKVTNKIDNLLRFTVVPVSSLSVKPSPAGTVKLLRFTVVHLTAVDTSSSEEIVPVHCDELGAAKAETANERKIRLYSIYR